MLNKTELPTEGGVLKIKLTVLLTMVDGKVRNAATGTTSTLKGYEYVYGLTSKDFNKLVKRFPEKPDTLRFGLSTLHTRIRFFESVLHISYRIPIHKWQARSEEEKRIVGDTKKDIQKKFKDELGLFVDIPKQGFGTLNYGNTVRRFFSETETASRITGVNLEFIKRLKVLLEAITSGYHIDEKKFQAYAYETTRLLLLSCDPFMSSSRHKSRKKSKPYSSETLQLLLPETSDGGSSDKHQDECEEEDEYQNSEESD
ncbi:hypothetical protein AVEN_60454-1 [Araneus ventricosus]|uniref:Uncharacterized protein n=1 Tax=Araneus ventricosus TaxID=182803 RepID=A0A4Y2UTI8_ARAVE|nr:hypothetical protein AVEN_60454-1 [Araneus ventricosus]